MNIIQYLSPTNLAQEKEKFLSSSTYNPVFQYVWNEPDAHQWALQSEYADLALALNHQDTQAIIQYAKKAFSTNIVPNFLEEAKRLTQHTPEKLPTRPINEIVSAFEGAFQELGLTEYSMEVVDQHGFNFRPSPKDKKITLSKHMNLDFFSVDGEVKHELVHVIRYENGLINEIPIAKEYLPTEEGLATYSQDYAGKNGHASLFQHAAEYTMTEVALNGSLRDIVGYLVGIGFSQELAWQRGVRHKFGWINTSEPGDIMKPSMYFYHQQLVRQLNNDERLRLFVGKITKEQLKDFPRYSGRISLERLQSFYTWNEPTQ